ncbi:MAG: hypothetical protein ACREFE_02500 [Limisphaerales bacterium]
MALEKSVIGSQSGNGDGFASQRQAGSLSHDGWRFELFVKNVYLEGLSNFARRVRFPSPAPILKMNNGIGVFSDFQILQDGKNENKSSHLSNQRLSKTP